MKKIKIILPLIAIMVMAFSALSEDGQQKKYSQEEFDKKVREEVTKQVEKIKKKSVVELANELLEKEQKLAQQEQEIKRKQEQLQISEKDLTSKIKNFEKDQKKILGCVESNQQAQKARIQQLVKVISNMKPAKAAEILSVQDAEISVKIIAEIAPERASKIFNVMDQEISARLQKQYLDMKK